MQMKRVIPKVGAAALTLGGGVAAAGCGSGDPVAAYCNTIADCYGYGRAYVDRCIRDYDYLLEEYAYYYGRACERSIRRLMRCEASLTCYDFIYFPDYYCGLESDDVRYYCGFWW
jgi:hypothetical protein